MDDFKTITDDTTWSEEVQVDDVSLVFGPEFDAPDSDSDDTTPKNLGEDEVLSTVSGIDRQQTPAPNAASYKPFPVDALPEVVGIYVSAAAAAIGCDPAFIALPLLVSLARAIGNRMVIRLKSTWLESRNYLGSHRWQKRYP